jgi:hypothetical protein
MINLQNYKIENENGCIKVTDVQGLGVELNHERIN